MLRLIACCFIPLAIMSISGCMASSGSFRWVNDPDQYLELSGFSIKAPTGHDWGVIAKNEDFPNSIAFVKLTQTPIRNNAEHYEFSVNVATAFGTAIGGLKKGMTENEAQRTVLEKCLQHHQRQLKYHIQESSFTHFQGAECIHYTGKQLNPQVDSYWGTINYERVSGYLCLHPDYNDFLVGIESKDGASVGQAPVNRDDQLSNFLRSLRFTPRAIPAAPPGEKSKTEGKRKIS